MRVGTLEECVQAELLDSYVVDERQPTLTPFPHRIVVECDFPELAVAVRWCWNKFGPRDGECNGQDEYAVCPLSLATERVEVRRVDKEYSVKRYDYVELHRHVGTWTTCWFGKTDYDHGFGEFCFADERQKDEFVAQVPRIDWGENYPWLKDRMDG